MNITGYNLSAIRTYILTRLQSLSEGAFFSDENKNQPIIKGLPPDREIFLFIFVFFVVENDSYYRERTSVDSIF